MDVFIDNDPLSDRSLQVKRQIETALLPYKELYQTKKNQSKQTTISSFYSKRSATVTTEAAHEVSSVNSYAFKKPKQSSLLSYFGQGSTTKDKVPLSENNQNLENGDVITLEDFFSETLSPKHKSVREISK